MRGAKAETKRRAETARANAAVSKKSPKLLQNVDFHRALNKYKITKVFDTRGNFRGHKVEFKGASQHSGFGTCAPPRSGR